MYIDVPFFESLFGWTEGLREIRFTGLVLDPPGESLVIVRLRSQFTFQENLSLPEFIWRMCGSYMAKTEVTKTSKKGSQVAVSSNGSRLDTSFIRRE